MDDAWSGDWTRDGYNKTAHLVQVEVWNDKVREDGETTVMHRIVTCRYDLTLEGLEIPFELEGTEVLCGGWQGIFDAVIGGE